ncbi:MAG: DUF1559 domain-containing protein [Isosphaeraceae bacterium]
MRKPFLCIALRRILRLTWLSELSALSTGPGAGREKVPDMTYTFSRKVQLDNSQAVYNGLNLNLENWHPANRTASGTVFTAYLCPENPNIEPKPAAKVQTADGAAYQGATRFAPLHNGANWGGGRSIWGQDFAQRVGTCQGVILPVLTKDSNGRPTTNIRTGDIIDGIPITLTIVEKWDSQGWSVGGWGGSEFHVNTSPVYTGGDPKARMVYTGSFHEDGPRAVMADGSGAVLRPTMNRQLWYFLITRHGGEVIKGDQVPPLDRPDPIQRGEAVEDVQVPSVITRPGSVQP